MNDKPDIIEQQSLVTWSSIGGFLAGFAVAFVLFAVGAMAAKVNALTDRAVSGAHDAHPKTVSVTVWLND